VRPDRAARRGGALLLAAGFARRFGSDKRRHLLDDGATLLAATLSLYVRAFDQVVVVLRPDDDDIQAAIREAFPAVSCVNAPLAHLGMGHSLAAGIAAVSDRHHDWEYAFVGLADMPFVRVETLAQLRHAMEKAPSPVIVQPLQAGRPGHPVGFHRFFFRDLGALTGDQGARRVVEQHRDALVAVVTTDEGVVKDMDTPP